MGLQVWRIVTGYDGSGRGIVVTADVIHAVSRGLGSGITARKIWSTSPRNAPDSKIYNHVGSGEETTIRITEWASGYPLLASHRDDGLLDSIFGEIDGGEVVHMEAGDALVSAALPIASATSAPCSRSTRSS